LQTSAVYCLPSFGEPYGMTAIEAMAAGLPLVVTNTGGLAELADERGALHVPERDVAALRDALLAVLQNPERARAMGDHNMRRARNEFAWDVVVDSLEAAYAAVRHAPAVQR
jgi:glycosyltransferase involved in cell wall biosynthesis